MPDIRFLDQSEIISNYSNMTSIEAKNIFWITALVIPWKS